MQIFISVRHDRSGSSEKLAAAASAATPMNFLQVKRDLTVFFKVRVFVRSRSCPSTCLLVVVPTAAAAAAEEVTRCVPNYAK